MTKIYKRPTSLSAPWLRTFGIYIPWLVVGGEFRRRGKRKFWCSRYKRDSIVIELEDEEFHRLVLNVADVNQEIDMLLEKISSLTFKFSYDLFL